MGTLGCAQQQESTRKAGGANGLGALGKDGDGKSAEKGDGKESLADGEGKTIYFDFDSRSLNDDARPKLAKIAEEAKKTNASVRIEGNTDERGTDEYNMALGEERARAAKVYLEQMGVPRHKVQIVTYGAERPKTDGHDESAWSKNRRDEIVLK